MHFFVFPHTAVGVEMMLSFPHFLCQYHRQRVKSRDDVIKNLASKHGIPGYSQQQEFSASSIRSFLSKLSQIRQRMEEEATQRKVGVLYITREMQIPGLDTRFSFLPPSLPLFFSPSPLP